MTITDYQKFRIFKRLLEGEATIKVLSDYFSVSAHIKISEWPTLESLPIKDVMSIIEDLQDD